MVAAILAGGFAVPAGGADVFKGRDIYASYCASCHGQAGMTAMPGAPNFARGDRLMQPDTALFAAIRSGRNAMPAFAGVLRDQEILDVIAFLRTMR